MAWFAPFIVPMAIGALSSMASGRNALEGAAIGAATQGLLGGVDFGGASNLFSGGAGTVATSAPTLGGLTLEGARTGAVGGALSSGASAGLSTSLPQTAGQASSIYGGDAALQNYDMGMGGIQSQIGGPVNVPMASDYRGMTAGLDYPDYASQVSQAPTNGYVYNPNEIETMANIRDFGSMTGTGDAVTNEPLFGGLIGDDMSASDVMGYTQLANAAYNRQTETPLVDTPDLGKITRKEVNPSEGTLLAINVPSSDIDKKIRFYG